MRVAATALPYQIQIVSDSSRYITCPVKQENDEWFFKFKGQWHRLDDYTDGSTRVTRF